METRRFGRTDLDMSLLTFGCGAVGGLMTKGEAADQDRAVAWARDHGINHFDTAPLYGNGASEENLGRALGANRDGIIVSTKVRLAANDRANLSDVIRTSIDDSLRRLRQGHVDLFQLHNTLGPAPDGMVYSAEEILNDVVPVFESLVAAGKTRYLGFTANGETDAIHELIASGKFDGAQIFYNVLNPTAGEEMPDGYPAQDYRGALKLAQTTGVGTIGVRVLAGGALSGSEARNPLGMEKVDPIGSGRDYATDVARARRFNDVLQTADAADLPELAMRYVIANLALTTTEIGIANLEEVQKAAAAINKGPLPEAALRKIDEIRNAFVGEAR